MEGNRFTILLSIVLALVLTLAISALSCGQKGEAREKTGVVVSIVPLADFVENVGGERVGVSVMVPPGANYHTYEPTPSQMVALAKAKMYAKVGSGIDFELAWMGKLKAANKGMLVVDCSRGVQLIEMAGDGNHRDEHGAMDPHVWLSPLNAKIMVQNIYEGLVQLDPEGEVYYQKNWDAYLQKLTQLDQEIRDSLSRVTNRKFMVYHPAFGYFAQEYNLTMLAIEAEGKEPTAASIAHLIKQAREYNIKVIFASPQFNPASAKVIAKEIGGRVVFIDYLARDYIANLRHILSELVQAME